MSVSAVQTTAPASDQTPEAIVLVHGLYVHSDWGMAVLRYRLASMGFAAFRFSYPSVGASPEHNARCLGRFLERIQAPTIHLVGHSLGGLVIRHLFHLSRELRPGRVVTLATPHQGSSVAARLAKTSAGLFALGKSLDHGLRGDAPAWTGARELGVIAGSRSLGLGRMVATLNGLNDGTVAVSEASLPNATDLVILPFTHFGMLFSAIVARQVGQFLRSGRFGA